MKIIRNATIYKAVLPSIDALTAHLAEMPFVAMPETHAHSCGFINNPATGELVTPIAGGMSFTVRIDEKILPSSAVSYAVAEQAEMIEKTTGRNLSRKERLSIKETVLAEMVKVALIKTTSINVLYRDQENYLVVPTTSKALAQTVTAMLVKVMGSLKTTTIHISDIKQGMTTRLREHLDGQQHAFGEFALGNYVQLAAERSKATFDLNLGDAHDGIAEGLSTGMTVENIELEHGNSMSLRVTKDFALRKITFFGDLTEEEEEHMAECDHAELWRIEAATQLLQVSAAVDALCIMFDYKEPEKDRPDAAF